MLKSCMTSVLVASASGARSGIENYPTDNNMIGNLPGGPNNTAVQGDIIYGNVNNACGFGKYQVRLGICVDCPKSSQNRHMLKGRDQDINEECTAFWSLSKTPAPTKAPTMMPTPAYYAAQETNQGHGNGSFNHGAAASSSASADAYDDHTITPTPNYGGDQNLAATAAAAYVAPISCPAGKYAWSSGKFANAHSNHQDPNRVTGKKYCLVCKDGWETTSADQTKCTRKASPDTLTDTYPEGSEALHHDRIHINWQDDYADTIIDPADWADSTISGGHATTSGTKADGTGVILPRTPSSTHFNMRGAYMPPQNVHYNPSTVKKCCMNECAADSLTDDRKADCKIGCDSWMSKSSLNWQGGGWSERLEKQCVKDCYQPGLWAAHKQKSPGDTESYWHSAAKAGEEEYCQRGCKRYSQCVIDHA